MDKSYYVYSPVRVWHLVYRWHVATGAEYNVKRLAWYEIHIDVTAAITREKQLKKWNRAWKIDLIQKEHPRWRDLFDDFTA